jgi:hypothetical protein
MLNIILCGTGILLGLLDHCLIVSADMPVSGQVLTLLVLQLGVGVMALLLVNGFFPTLAEMAFEFREFRLNMFVFGVPVLFFLWSPYLLSNLMYTARYGYFDQILVDAHVFHDLRCCLNPFTRPRRP